MDKKLEEKLKDLDEKLTVLRSGGPSILTLLTVLFIGLKLGNVIDWSWWWVLSPLWIPLAFGLVLIIIIIIAGFSIAAFKSNK